MESNHHLAYAETRKASDERRPAATPSLIAPGLYTRCTVVRCLTPALSCPPPRGGSPQAALMLDFMSRTSPLPSSAIRRTGPRTDGLTARNSAQAGDLQDGKGRGAIRSQIRTEGWLDIRRFAAIPSAARPSAPHSGRGGSGPRRRPCTRRASSPHISGTLPSQRRSTRSPPRRTRYGAAAPRT